MALLTACAVGNDPLSVHPRSLTFQLHKGAMHGYAGIRYIQGLSSTCVCTVNILIVTKTILTQAGLRKCMGQFDTIRAIYSEAWTLRKDIGMEQEHYKETIRVIFMRITTRSVP